MTLPVFPVLAGQGWSVHKKPTFSTLVASHVSGREVRDGQYVNPIWQYELSFDGLDSTNSFYPGLGGNSLQSLMGLFLQCQGRFGAFLYFDPTDYFVLNQTIGIATGSNTIFQLVRTLGAFTEAIVAPLVPATPTILSLPGAPQYAANNLVPWSQDVTKAPWALSGVNVSSGASDAFGGNNAQTLTATAADATASQSTSLVAPSLVNSLWIRRRTGSGSVNLSAPNGVLSTVPITTTWQRFSAPGRLAQRVLPMPLTSPPLATRLTFSPHIRRPRTFWRLANTFRPYRLPATAVPQSASTA